MSTHLTQPRRERLNVLKNELKNYLHDVVSGALEVRAKVLFIVDVVIGVVPTEDIAMDAVVCAVDATGVLVALVVSETVLPSVEVVSGVVLSVRVVEDGPASADPAVEVELPVEGAGDPAVSVEAVSGEVPTEDVAVDAVDAVVCAVDATGVLVALVVSETVLPSVEVV